MIMTITDTNQTTAAAASRAPQLIAPGVLREIALGPEGLTLGIGAHRVTFSALGAFSPAGLSQLHGTAVTLTEVAAGHYAIAGPTADETILADTVEVVPATNPRTGAHTPP
jgi:hypothetical protein